MRQKIRSIGKCPHCTYPLRIMFDASAFVCDKCKVRWIIEQVQMPMFKTPYEFKEVVEECVSFRKEFAKWIESLDDHDDISKCDLQEFMSNIRS